MTNESLSNGDLPTDNFVLKILIDSDIFTKILTAQRGKHE